MIRIERLYKSFGDELVLNNFNYNFDEGKVYGIMGENGAGKTTLFRCIAGLENYSGNILSDVLPLKDHLGLLPTEPYFFSKIKGKEYLDLLCFARGKSIAQIAEKNVFDLPLDQYASIYSTGMKKKLALLGVLLQGNKYFILDEPFNGVDIHSNLIISEIILKLKALNKTIIISSHIFSSLNDICDEIILLNKGKEIRIIPKSEFAILEKELKSSTIGNKIDFLDLK